MYAIFAFDDAHVNKKKDVSVSEDHGVPFYCTATDELLSYKTLEDKISVSKSSEASSAAVAELNEDEEGSFDGCLDLGAEYVWDSSNQSLGLLVNNIRVQCAEFAPDGVPLQKKP